MFQPPRRAGGQLIYEHEVSPQRDAVVVIDDTLGGRDKLSRFFEIHVSGRRVFFAALGLAAANTVKTLVRGAADGGYREHVWSEWIPWLVYDALERYRTGEPHVRLSTVPEEDDDTFILPGFLRMAGATSLVSKGGSLKSYLALAAAVAIATGDPRVLGIRPRQTGQVVYLDWEDDPGEHRRRLSRICRGADIPPPYGLIYQNQRRPLRDGITAVHRLVDEADARLVIVDSVMLARGGEAAAEDTIAFYSALRQLARPILLIDHKTKKGKDERSGPYGSVINENSMRLGWDVDSFTVGKDVYGMRLSVFKTNATGRLRDLGWRVDFATRAKTTFMMVDDPAQLAMQSGVPFRDLLVDALLRGGSKSVDELAEMFGTSSSTVRARLNEAKKAGRVEHTDGKPQLWFVPESPQEELPDAF